MIEGIIQGGLTALLKEGAGWIVAVLVFATAVIIIRYLMKELTGARGNCDSAQKEYNAAVLKQAELRLEDSKETLTTANRSSSAMEALKVSVDARITAMNELTAGFAQLVRDQDGREKRWSDKAQSLEDNLRDIRARLEDLQRRVP